MREMRKASDLRIPFVWEERRPVLLERFLYVPPLYESHDAWTPIPWSDPTIFGNNQPVFVEYCSGNGQWICERAKECPEINWVANDIRFDRSRKIWARLHRENIPNLYILSGDARVLTRHYIPKKSVSEFFVNFPDPWPKLRHAKHRLVQDSFLSQMVEVALPGAAATFVTDDETYAAQILSELFACLIWRPRLEAPYYALDWPDYGNSYFYDLWKKRGRTIRYIPFTL